MESLRWNWPGVFVDLLGIDFAEGMISAAIQLADKIELQGKVQFRVSDHTSIRDMQDRFDLVYSERAMINLKNWECLDDGRLKKIV